MRAGREERRRPAAAGGPADPPTGVALVFLDGEYGEPGFYRDLVTSARQVLAADGGARFLLGLGVRPDVVVGDFDSLSAADTRRLEGEGVELIRHPVRKDSTDGELAVDEALRRGAGELVLAGGTGALDHTLGHLAILGRLAALGVPARLVTPSLTVRVFRAPADVVLGAGAGTRVSLAPLGGDASVTLTGLEYPLDHGALPAEACLGLGNRVLDAGAARIGLHSGSVAVLVETGDERFGGSEGRRGARPADATETQGTAS